MTSQQNVNLPNEAPCPLSGTNFADVALIQEALSALPYGRVGVLMARLNAMAAQAIQDYLNPPPFSPMPEPPPAPISLLEHPLLGPVADHETACLMLKQAEEHRRAGDGTLAKVVCHPEEDYAAATLLVARAMHHLDEALPNGQRERTLAAYGALRFGVYSLGQYLARAL